MAKLDKRARHKRKAERTARELAIARNKPAPQIDEERRVVTVTQSFPGGIRTEIPPELLARLRPARFPHPGDDGAADTAVIVTAEISAAAIASTVPPGKAVFSCHSPAGMELMNFDELLGFDRIIIWPNNDEPMPGETLGVGPKAAAELMLRLLDAGHANVRPVLLSGAVALAPSGTKLDGLAPEDLTPEGIRALLDDACAAYGTEGVHYSPGE